MAEMAVVDEPTLQQVFDAGWDAQRKIEAGDLCSNTDDFKALVKDGIGSLERATLMVNQLSLFSGNEGVEELATSDLRYLLLPALLGDLTMQEGGGERLDHLERARVYFVDYLQRAKSYSITQDDPPTPRETLPPDTAPPPSRPRSMEQAAADRSNKIARLRAKKDMEKKIKELADRLKEPSTQDETLIREHLLSLLRYWVVKCQEGVASVDQEMDLLEQMRNRPVDRQPVAGPHPPGQAARPPLVITRDMVKGQVFGAGYPSLPSMSVEQFFDQQYRQQMEREKEVPPTKSRVSDDEGEVDKEETEESLKRAREFDDFKDSNRRGAGNRKNMG